LTLQYAGEVADGVLIGSIASRTGLKAALTRINRGLSKSGRDLGDIELGVRLDACIASSREDAIHPLKPTILRTLIRYSPDFVPFTSIGLDIPPNLRSAIKDIEYKGYGRSREQIEKWADLVPDEFVDPFCLGGTVDEVAERVSEIMSLGINHVTIFPIAPQNGDIIDTIRAFANEATPMI
jgi:alkanesulfonate monooxygenase SsuD/methylene tetrahydromethanopterin reductase-like flavin-dependent oxidoreductase (luciferase family)